MRQGFQNLGSDYFDDLYAKVESDVQNNANRTPLAGSLSEAKAYLDAHKSTDPYKNCRKKFVIFLTDGWDTLACGANYDPVQDTQGWSYKRRRATVTAAKALADAGYKVFVIGFGYGSEMPVTLTNTLNWAAYYGGTDNPDEKNYENGVLLSGNPTSSIAVTNPCNEDGGCDSFTLTAGNCAALATKLGTDCCGMVGQDDARDCCDKAVKDPGFKNLLGYAFLASTAAALNTALRNSMEYVKSARYSFTVASVSAARLADENFLYEASLYPFSDDPFWQGHLKKYQIDSNGKLTYLWDMGEKLRDKTAASRSMYTLLGGTIKVFNTSNISLSHVGAASTSERDAIVGYFRGETTYNKDYWKLGDIFHANPITIASPPVFYNDFRSPAAYANHWMNNKTRERLVVLGANDGQFHAFSAGTGEEKWSFIPPNLLPKLKLVAHTTEPAPSPNHQFFVDGPLTVTEAWLGSGEGLDKLGTTGKNASEWKTLLIFGLGQGVRESHAKTDPAYLWSSSPNCDSDFKRKYNPPHQYYCGYYAFDVTNTSSTPPAYKWRINVADVSQGKHLDEPWSKMAIGRVRIDGNEKWVGFIGGGYNVNSDYDDDDVDTRGKRGKGFFVVDLTNGNILWNYTKETDSNMDYTIPASAAAVDWDSDGFVDTAYIADLGGNMWRFRFCSYEDYKNDQPCNTANWKGGRLFASTTGYVRPVFTRPTVASDAANQLWVFWGTGNKQSPRETGSQERFFALQDIFVPAKSGASPPSYIIDNLEDITSMTYLGTKPGWYIRLTGSGEKMLFDPTVFGGMALFTTYTPSSGGDLCAQGGTGKLYAMAMMPIMVEGVKYAPGTGLWASGARSITLGSGIPTAPLVSQKPGTGPTDVFVTVSGGGGNETVIKSVGDLPQDNCPACKRLALTPPQAQITHWRDKRIQ